jgi:hypothetical protein
MTIPTIAPVPRLGSVLSVGCGRELSEPAVEVCISDAEMLEGSRTTVTVSVGGSVYASRICFAQAVLYCGYPERYEIVEGT